MNYKSIRIERAAHLKGPLEHFYAILRDPYDPVLLQVPYAKNFQPSAAAIALAHEGWQAVSPPIIPDLFPSGAPKGEGGFPLPAPIAKKLAEMWTKLGQREGDEELLVAAERVMRWVGNLGQRAATLFYAEDSFYEEDDLSISMEPFFDESLGITCDTGTCFTLSGLNTGFGATRLANVEFRAFGPQIGTLTDCRGFGIDLQENLGSGWTRCFGNKEVWIHLFPTLISLKEVRFEVKFAGLDPQETAWISFYTKAKSCTFEDGTQFFPRSLQRFSGKSQKIFFDANVSLESLESLELQAIPLAGSDCYWNSTFLTAFKFSSSNNKSSFVIKLV